MNRVITSCGICPLRLGKYICSGLKNSRDEEGVKHHIGAQEHDLQPDWCPLPIALFPAEGFEEMVDEEKQREVEIDFDGATDHEIVILTVMGTMIEEGKDLTAEKEPEAPALSKEAGIEVSAEQRDELMKRITVIEKQEE